MDNQNKPKERTIELVNQLSNLVNNYNREDQEDFVKLVLREHPTLQQSMIRLMLVTIEAMAEKKYVDARNEESKLVCQQIVEGFKAARSGYDTKLHGRFINDAALPSQYLGHI